MRAEGRPCKDTGRGCPSAGQGQRSPKKPNWLTLELGTLASVTVTAKCLLFNTQSVVFCYGRPSKHTSVDTNLLSLLLPMQCCIYCTILDREGNFRFFFSIWYSQKDSSSSTDQ